MGRIFQNVTVSDLSQIRQYVRETAVTQGCDLALINELIYAVNEALANIVKHSYQNKPGSIEVRVIYQGGLLKVILLDDGPRFDPTTAPSPDTTLPLEKRAFGGLGIHMMRDFCDALNYRRDPQGRNELTLVKSAPSVG